METTTKTDLTDCPTFPTLSSSLEPEEPKTLFDILQSYSSLELEAFFNILRKNNYWDMQKLAEEHKKLTLASPETRTAIGENNILQMRMAIEYSLLGILYESENQEEWEAGFNFIAEIWDGFPEDTAIRLFSSLYNPASVPIQLFESVIKNSSAVQEAFLERCINTLHQTYFGISDFMIKIFKIVPDMDTKIVWNVFNQLFEKEYHTLISDYDGFITIGKIGSVLREPLQSEWIKKMVETDSGGDMISSFLKTINCSHLHCNKEGCEEECNEHKHKISDLLDILLERDTTGKLVADVMVSSNFRESQFFTPEKKAKCLEAILDKDTEGESILIGLRDINLTDINTTPLFKSVLNRAFHRIMELDGDKHFFDKSSLTSRLPTYMLVRYWNDILVSGKSFSEDSFSEIVYRSFQNEDFLSSLLDMAGGDRTMLALSAGDKDQLERILARLVSEMFNFRERQKKYLEEEDPFIPFDFYFYDFTFNKNPDIKTFMENMISLSHKFNEKYETAPDSSPDSSPRINLPMDNDTWDKLFSAANELLRSYPDRENLALITKFLDVSCFDQLSKCPLKKSLSSLLELVQEIEYEQMGGRNEGGFLTSADAIL